MKSEIFSHGMRKVVNPSCPQYLPLRDFDDVTNALNFDTADCHVVGGCDLYTTKAAGGDKKLYKNIEQSLESQYASLLSFSAALPPPQASAAAASLNLSRSSPFGPLSQTSSRRTFAYLIATLNASHPDYDFSHFLRPSDFRREKSLKLVMNSLDTTLYNLRPKPINSLSSAHPPWSSNITTTVSLASSGSEAWGPRMWRLIDKEMSLKECGIYCYSPEEDPYDGEEGAIWSFNYFFFNKARKRVCYIYLRGLSIISHSPAQKTPVKTKHAAEGDWSPIEPSNSKRARYWLGDRATDDVSSGWGEDEEEDVIEPWESEGLNTSEVLDDEDEQRYVTVADEPEPRSARNRSTDSKCPSAGSLSIDSPSTGRARSKSTVRNVSEEIAELMEV
ncbi:RNA polymerase III-inhibiting protein maf1 [Pseudocyphellaria aurata]|nr:RNA polymerase III-inhibiting protein maf1 [Pseudocyphellaria aurata]